MKTKNILMGLVGLCWLLALNATNAFANCPSQVIQAGAATGGKIVRLKNISGANCGSWANQTDRYLVLNNLNNNANAMLAAALSAQASGNTIVAIPSVGTNYTEWSSLQAVYAQATP